ncbi:MAG TPA: MDR family oxidoreductase [Thermoanaerobaculia bacterium]|nr:MDR family oxidoreductase [Thermoanaerobaculia bacterium]
MTFRALVARENAVALEDLTDDTLPAEGMLVDVKYSSLNYKDALAITRRGRIVRRFPMVLGIDLAGTNVETGESVIATAQGLGELEWGGLARRERVKADTLLPLPQGMSLEQSMQLGTAGFTAMLCVLALERNNVLPGDREVVVTGAAGGVGSIAVMLLARRGYKVAALTGRPQLESYFRGLGATSIVPREELAKSGAPMQSERWAGGIDTVGGTILTNLFAQTAYGGAIACCGMAGGHELNATVWPLILRNVSLLGVSSIWTSRAMRLEAWSRLAQDTEFARLAELSRTEPLSNIFALSEELLSGNVRGRIVIDVNR